MNVALVNCSEPHYNLGLAKMNDWLHECGDKTKIVRHTKKSSVDEIAAMIRGKSMPNVLALSVIFSWDAPLAAALANIFQYDCEVWCGGPGMFTLGKWWKDHTGLACGTGQPDPRFEKQRGNYKMTFASRGCPVGCWFCPVTPMEGREFTLYWDFQPAPVLCDNNLSALPNDFQQHIIDEYSKYEPGLMDANSGFEPRSFTEDTYHRWKSVLKGPWRFALDDMEEYDRVETMMQVLKSESQRRKRVYCLLGNESKALCLHRATSIIRWGGEPFCQIVVPLNWLGNIKDVEPKHDWDSVQQQHDLKRYFNSPQLWRTTPLREYKPRVHEPPPFADAKFDYKAKVFAA